MRKKMNWAACFCFVAGLVVFVACENQFDAPLAEQKLIEVLVDIHTAEALTESEKQEVRDSMNGIYYAQIFEHHGIKKMDFDSTMSIYAHNPDRFDTVYNRVARIVKSKRDTMKTH